MRRLSGRSAMTEARRFKTLTLGRAVGSGAGGVALPQPTVQNQMIIADATPAWTLLAAPTALGQVPIAGADPYTPVWGTTFPAVIQFDAGITFGGATGVNVVTVPDNVAQAMHVVDAGGIEYLRIVSTDAQPVFRVNPGTIDMDFQVRASGIANALFVRGSDHYIGMNVEDPLAPLHVHGRVLLNTGLAFGGTVPTPYIETPDNAAIALRLIDAGTLEYLRIISTDAQPVVVFNEGGADIDYRWEASGKSNALFMRGSTGFWGINTGAPTTWFEIVDLVTNYPCMCLSAGVNGEIATPTGEAIRLGHWDAGTTTFTERFRIDNTGDVRIWEDSNSARLTGTVPIQFGISEPIVEVFGQFRIPWACTVTRVDANVIGGTSCTFNIEERSTLGSAGTNVLSSDMAADANGESVTSAFNNSSLAAGNYLTVDISAVSGAVEVISITLTVTID